MTERAPAKVVIWPFLLMDIVFFGLAYLIFHFGHRPLLAWEVFAIILCVALGAWTFLKPFRTKLRMAESENLIDAAQELKKFEHIANQVSSSTSLWQSIQEQASKTAGNAKVISDQMAREAKAFSDFLQQANDTEKAHLRLEVEKLKQTEVEWLETLVRVADHIFALHSGAVRSGQQRLIEQISNFRAACSETMRRVGLSAFAPAANEAFDAARYQLAPGDKSETSGVIADTLMCGYMFRGKLLRRAVVRVKSSATAEVAGNATTGTATATEPTVQTKPTAPVSATGELPLS